MLNEHETSSTPIILTPPVYEIEAYHIYKVRGKKERRARLMRRTTAMVIEDWKWPAYVCGHIDRSHLLFITVIHGDPRCAGVGGPGGTTMTRTFVPQLARTRIRTRGRVPRLSFVEVRRLRRFESGYPSSPNKRARARHATAYARRRI